MMSKRKTTEQFILEANLIHNNLYGYKHVIYMGKDIKIKIDCYDHGIFLQRPHDHLNGSGCPICSGRKKITTEQFIEDAIKIHGYKYNYDDVECKGINKKVKIRCLKHGLFEQVAYSHLNGHGCVACVGLKRKTTEEFIFEAKIVHGDLYLYTETKCINITEPVKIICQIHGIFMQRPSGHLQGQGCPICSGNIKKTYEKFVEESHFQHNNKYTYSEFVYISNKVKGKITCPFHGIFEQTPHDHLDGHGCSECAGLKKKTREKFILEAKIIHGEIYNYDNSEYNGIKIKTRIDCLIHGSFYQMPNHHLRGSGCPSCGHMISKPEIKWLDSLEISSDNRQISMKINKRLFKFDAFNSKTNTIYEFYGDFWHGNPQKYKAEDYNKMSHQTFGELYQKTLERESFLKNAGYLIVSIWEYDFINVDI